MLIDNCDRKIGLYGTKVICKYFKDYYYNIECGIRLISIDKQTYSTFVSLKLVIIEKLRVTYIQVEHYQTSNSFIFICKGFHEIHEIVLQVPSTFRPLTEQRISDFWILKGLEIFKIPKVTYKQIKLCF